MVVVSDVCADEVAHTPLTFMQGLQEQHKASGCRISRCNLLSTTGFHGLHVFMGVVLLLYMYFRSLIPGLTAQVIRV
jgi:heme/copper-type cytochrome/quinol oxidase subunit 3